MSTDILQRLREANLGIQVVGLRFRTGPMPPVFERRTPKRRAPEGRPTRDLPAPVGRALAGVGDDDLRELIAQAAASSLRLQDE